jgi:glycosyltransferase involved in cell wall biosynthesis
MGKMDDIVFRNMSIMNGSHIGSVLIFSHLLLESSATFIKSQSENLSKFSPYYVGSRYINALPLPIERVIVVNSGGIRGAASELYTRKFGFMPRFIEKVRETQPKLIHAHFGPSGTIALPLAKTLNVPLVTTYHGFDATVSYRQVPQDQRNPKLAYLYRNYERRKKQLISEGALFIAVSEFIRDKLISQGFPQERTTVHYIGIDTEKFKPDADLIREPAVLFVGRLVEKKGCEYLIKAMSLVHQADKSVKLVIIGDGPLAPTLKSLAKDVLQPGSYTFLGYQPSWAVKEWMNKSSILAVPSVTASNGDSEGAPTVILEAQAMELPIVATRHSGIPEIVMQGKTGLLSEERDCNALAQNILFLLNSSLSSFGKEGRAFVSKFFNLKMQNEKLEHMYENVISQL